MLTPEKNPEATKDTAEEAKESVTPLISALENLLSGRMPKSESGTISPQWSHTNLSPQGHQEPVSVSRVLNTHDHSIEVDANTPPRFNWSVRIPMSKAPIEIGGVPFKVTELSLETKYTAQGRQVTAELYGAGNFVASSPTKEELNDGMDANYQFSSWEGEKVVVTLHENAKAEGKNNQALISEVIKFVTSNLQRESVRSVMASL